MDDVEMSFPLSWAPEGSRVVAISSLLEALLLKARVCEVHPSSLRSPVCHSSPIPHPAAFPDLTLTVTWLALR